MNQCTALLCTEPYAGRITGKINGVLPSVFTFLFPLKHYAWNIKCIAETKSSATAVTPTANTNQPVFCTHRKRFRCQTPVMPPHYKGKEDKVSLVESIFTGADQETNVR